MPLPANSSLSLQGQLRPGTKPKLAMVVRMTEEALDSLQQLDVSEQMEFEFGDRPGIHIRTSFFPLKIQTSPGDSELYVRTTTHARPAAPLKLSAAALAGRILVERTSAHIPDTAVKRREALEQEKERNKIKMLPVTTVKTATKIKRVASPRNTQVATPGHTRVSSSSNLGTSVSNGGGSVPTTTLSKDEEAARKNRLIHFLALGPQPFSVINKEAGGDDALTSMFLREIADQEPLPKNSTVQHQDQPWRLKPRSWLSVRPFTYLNYSDAERVAVSRSARVWFGNMKIHDSDPLWEHVRFRGSNGNGEGTVPATSAASTSTTKERKGAKRDVVEVKMKSEVGASSSKPAVSSLHALSRSSAGVTPSTSLAAQATAKASGSLKPPTDGDGDKEEGELSASSTPPPPRALANASAAAPSRKPPGSSKPLVPQQQNKHNVFMPPNNRPMTPPVPATGNLSNAQAAGPSSQLQSSTGGPVKRSSGPVDARTNRRPPPPEPSERARPLPPIAPPIPVTSASDKNAPKRRDGVHSLPSSSSQQQQKTGAASKAKAPNREREREKEENKLERERDREKRERERDAKQQERELAKAKEKERERERAQKRKLQLAASSSTPPIPSSAGSNNVASSKKKRARAEPSVDASDGDSSDFDMEELHRDKRRKKEERLRESAGAGSASSGRADSGHHHKSSSKLDRAYERERERDMSSSRRGTSPLPRKMKREESVSVPPASQEYLSTSQQTRSSSGAVTSSKTKVRASDAARGSSAKMRRPSPKFTSDEEEGEEEEERPLKKVSSSASSRRGKTKAEADIERAGVLNSSKAGAGAYLHPASAGSARPSPSPRPSHALPHKPPPPASAPVISSSTKMERVTRSPTPRDRDRDRHERGRGRSRSPARRRSALKHETDADDAMDLDVDHFPSPSDHESLRERYANTYAAYIDVFQKVLVQKNKITRVLQSRNSASGSASVSESEADVMSPEEIEKLSREHRRLHGELESIRSLHAQ